MTVDIDKLKAEQGSNITYLRRYASFSNTVLTDEIRRACDDIEAYREIVGLMLKVDVLNGDDENRLKELLDAMSWGNA